MTTLEANLDALDDIVEGKTRTTREVIAEILAGDHDAKLDEIRSALDTRREVMGRVKFREFNDGDKVRIVEPCRPKYLVGCEATLIRKKQKKVVIEFDDPPKRFDKHGRPKWTGQVTIPVELIEAA